MTRSDKMASRRVAGGKDLAATLGGVPEDLRSTAALLLQMSAELRVLIKQADDALLLSRQLRQNQPQVRP